MRFRKKIPKPSGKFRLFRLSLKTMQEVINNGRLLETYSIGKAKIYIYEYEGLGYYLVEEPELNELELKLYEVLMDSLYYTVKPIEHQDLVRHIESSIRSTARELGIEEEVERSFDKLMYYIVRDVVGYGPLDVLIKDPRIEDISLEGVGKPVRVFHRDYSDLEWLITNIVIDDEEYLDGLVSMIAHKSGKHISTAFPIAEGALPEKHRVTLTYSREVTPFGSSITIRKFREEPLTIAHLIKYGTVSSLMAAYWWFLLENKGSVFIVGEMASGKSVHPHSTILALFNGKPIIMSIEDLWNKMCRCGIRPQRVGDYEVLNLQFVDLKILTTDGREIKFARPRFLIRHKAPKELVRIRLRSGLEFIVTNDHSLITLSRGVLKVKRPDEVLRGDLIQRVSPLDAVNYEYIVKKLSQVLIGSSVRSIHEILGRIRSCSKFIGGNEYLIEVSENRVWYLLYVLSLLGMNFKAELKDGYAHVKFLDKPMYCKTPTYDAIEDIETISSNVTYVYDFEVPGTQVFEVCTAFVHNTTLLNALASMLPPSWKIVTIEDTPELRLPHIGWKPLVARHVYTLAESKTEVSLFDLVKLSLRERAQFIIVGEIRGEEAYVFVQALASVTPDTPILIRTRDGSIQLVRIGELVDKYYGDNEHSVPKYVDGIEVLTIDKNLRVRWAPIRYVLRHKASEIYIIRYPGGEIRVTGSHSVFTFNPITLSIELKPACRISKGDLLITFRIHRDLDQNGKRGDWRRAFLAGAFISRGRITKDTVEFRLANGEHKYGEKLAAILTEFIGTRPEVINNGNEIIIRCKDKSTVSIISNLLRLFDKHMIITTILNEGREVFVNFLRGLSKISNSNSKCFEIDFNLADRMMPELIWLAHMMGFVLSVDEGKVLICEDSKDMSGQILDHESSKQYRGIDRYGVSPVKYVKALSRMQKIINGDLELLPVLEVSRDDYDGYVYDVSVPETEAFFGGHTPILLHNTGHGGACTFHGDSLESMIMRLTTPPINVPVSFLPLIGNVIITRFIRIPGRKPVRRVVEVHEIIGARSPSEVDYITLFTWNPETDKHEPSTAIEVVEKSHKLERIARLLGWTKSMVLDELELRRRFLESLVERGIMSYSEVVRHIRKFYEERRRYIHE